MQQAIYPLVPVICDDEQFAEAYNTDMMSSLYQSTCMRVSDVEKMIDEGASFSQMVFINNDSNAFIDKYKFDGQWRDEVMPEIVHVKLENISKNAVNDVHRAIQNVIYNKGTG